MKTKTRFSFVGILSLIVSSIIFTGCTNPITQIKNKLKSPETSATQQTQNDTLDQTGKSGQSDQNDTGPQETIESSSQTSTNAQTEGENSQSSAQTQLKVNNSTESEISLSSSKEGQTALELLQSEVSDVETQDFGNAGVFIKSINGLASDDQHYWAFYLNGKYSNTGVSQTVLQSGDSIKFVYETVDPTQK